MAKKVFRIHKGQAGSGWFVSNPITTNDLKTILTDGKEVASSIPSPFARIDLVKSAFKWVADNGIDGKTAQHKLVSDALDVAQSFFLYPQYQNKLKIVSWIPNDRFLNLKTNPQHSELIETLDTYWKQDGNVYNFNKVQRLYFLINNANQVIGGTSPATLFFAAPDVHKSTEDLNIVSNDDKLFDTIYFSLAKRDRSFVKYFFTLSKQPNFSILFPEVYSYLEAVRSSLNYQNVIASITPAEINNYKPCLVLDTVGNHCEILGIPLGVKAEDSNQILNESGFVITPDFETSVQPLVLPHGTFAERWAYTNSDDIWSSNNSVPYKNTATEEDSVLPIQNNKYPWLTIGNFLEDKIIELPYTIDSSKFHTCGSKKHLLPLTSTFFKYFNAENVSNYLKLESLSGGGVQAQLTIPVRSGAIIFKKTYNKEDVEKMEIHLAILPFVRTSQIDLDYTLALQDKRYSRNNNIILKCFENSNPVNIENPVVRRPGENNTIRSIYYKTKVFNRISIGINDFSGAIIPKMHKSSATQSVSFAVDFGTTNTHIEYKYGPNAERALDIATDLPMWQSLIDRERGETQEIVDDDNFESQLFPYLFGNDETYKFPFRTALAYNKNINFNEHPIIGSFTHTNNFLLLEKKHHPRYFNLRTKLKWGNYEKPEDRRLVEKYIEGLMHMLLYKVLLLNGNPETTNITWFYPVSMDDFEQGIFFETWIKTYKKIFKSDNDEKINAIPESIAPYLHYRALYPGLSLSVDIGGGSTDIAIFRNANDLPEFISSFKFAGNAVFGDGFTNGFANSSDNNGFVKAYRNKAETAINQNTNKKEILDDILNHRKDSSDFSSFLFSLENGQDINFNYTDLLRQDKKLKLPILVFYAAIMYYSANLLKKYGINEVPKNILLSGTASKTVKIIDPKNDCSLISTLFIHIFKEVTGIGTENLKIAFPENPKEITCKGALKAGINKNVTECPIIFWLGGNDDKSVWGKVLNKKTDITLTPYYNSLEENENKQHIENSIKHFYTVLDGFVDSINLEGTFGIDNIAYNKFKEIRSTDIKDFLEQGIKAFFRSQDKHIEETLFFYPLIGILNKLSSELVNMDNK